MASSMSPADAKKAMVAQDFYLKAEKAVTPGFLGRILRTSSDQYADARSKFILAANNYKAAKLPSKAAEAFLKAAECAHLEKNPYDEADAYRNAASCFRNLSSESVIQYLKMSIDLNMSDGRFSTAAKQTKEAAEEYEKEKDVANAIEMYTDAANLYEGEKSTSASNGCLLKAAQFKANLEKYSESISLFNKVADRSLDNGLLKWSVKEYYLNAGLCYLANNDLVGCQLALDSFKDKDPSFHLQRECDFLEKLVKAVEQYNSESLTEAVNQFDCISPLDPWRVSLLLKIKRMLQKEEAATSSVL